MEIIMNNSRVEVGNAANGDRIMQVTDNKSGVVIIIPMTPEAARSIGTALSTSLVVAGGPLPPTNGKFVS